MRLIAVIVLLGTGLTVNCENHSLTYIYTALSKPVKLPGFHEFTAMSLMDDRIIDYFDSDLQKKVPRRAWMREQMDEDYWDEETRSLQSTQQWLKDKIQILKKKMGQNDSDVHVLQWIHGCEAESAPDSGIKFVRGMDRFCYDGEDLLSNDDTLTEAAVPTKRKRDDVQVLKEYIYTEGPMENECMDSLRKFMSYEKKQLMSARLYLHYHSVTIIFKSRHVFVKM
ncbi:popy class I histocompatibility antigen, alpha chain E-like [Centropristis striata]|uniref:popy class I histocompatibility antigen, alpha chain E-like n=1 Tax=Centropristis striata TaxID=184440 RepID=UPI0027E1D8B6|nr:popy class I histocompatibility antigen, alpha chain E-like [Centropristis striata]